MTEQIQGKEVSSMGQNPRGTTAWLAVLALAIVMLACIGVGAAALFTLMDKIHWHELWDRLYPALSILGPSM